jgi:Viral BACON domain
VHTPVVTGDFLAVAGVINPTANTAGISFIRRMSDAVNVPALTPGDYSIRLLDGSNNTLVDYAFTAQQEAEASTLSFGQVVDFVAGTRKVEIVKLADGSVLDSQTVSANPPTISNVALQGAPEPVSGVVTLGWTASDPDGDALSFDVAYSRDNGTTFQPVATNLSGSSAQIDTAQLGGSGTAILRVTASDGVNSAYADSASFVMANKPPQPYIPSPADNTHIHYGQLVNFNGMALDAQDGTVDGSGLVWKDQNNNTLGSGALLSLDALPVGSNVITLQATNSVGQSASASVTVIVDDDLNLPGPTLTTGPDQVGWQVGEGSTQVQSAPISIGNAGSGTLDWTASSSASWLTLDATSGSVDTGDPAILTASADPSGLAGGTIYSANITIYVPASGSTPAQKAVIPVSLSVGDVRATPPGHFSGNYLFMPLLQR